MKSGEPIMITILGYEITEQIYEGVRAVVYRGRRKRYAVLDSLPNRIQNKIEELEYLPEMKNPDKLAAMRILLRISSAVYFTDPKLAPLISLKGVNLSIKHGNAPASAYSYAGYGLTLCGGVGDINSGYQFGNLALNLLDRFDAQEFKARTSFLVHSFVKHWKEHVGELLQLFYPDLDLKGAYHVTNFERRRISSFRRLNCGRLTAVNRISL